MNTFFLDGLAIEIANRIKSMQCDVAHVSKMDKRQADEYYKAFDRRVTPRENAFKKKLGEYFMAQKNQVKANLKNVKSGFGRIHKITAEDLDSILFGDTEWKRKYQEMLGPEYEETILIAGNNALKQVGVGIDFNLANENIQDYIGTHIDDIAGLVNETTANALIKTLEEGIANGESIQDLAQRIELVFEDAIGYRSTTIARTETISAYSEATLAGYEQSGVVDEIEWIATRDDRVRDDHLELDGKTVPLNGVFVFPDGTTTQGPGLSGNPNQDINCRCAIAAVIKDY